VSQREKLSSESLKALNTTAGAFCPKVRARRL
jgi:hypothetical protein